MLKYLLNKRKNANIFLGSRHFTIHIKHRWHTTTLDAT